MKRSASASFEEKEMMKERDEGEDEKKITTSVQTKKSAKKMHDDVDDYPSPIRVKKEEGEVPRALVPLDVNDGPTEKEKAAAKAARIRLGYEKADSKSTIAEELANETPMKCPSGTEPIAVVEVEYLTTDELKPLENVDETTQNIVTQLGTKDWQEMCATLNTARQLTVHHPSECLTILPSLVPAVLKLFKNPRSSVCKTAVLCLADLLHSQQDEMLPYLDVGGLAKPTGSVLYQLLLKSTTDKQFVAEETNKALKTMGSELSVTKMTQLLTPYASEHKNPKVRGKAGTILASVTERMTSTEWEEIGIPSLLRVAAVLVTDKTPDAREAARIMIVRIQSVLQQESLQKDNTSGAMDGSVTVNVSLADGTASSKQPEEDEPYLSYTSSDDEEPAPKKASPWQLFCEEHLTMTQAIAVLKVQPSSTK